MLLLDTNVISEPRRRSPAANVVAWFDRQPIETLFLSSVTWGELLRGAHRSRAAGNPALMRWIEDDLHPAFAGRILPFTDRTAAIWAIAIARLEAAGRPRPAFDSLIAATAVEHRLSIVTRNVADFEGFGVEVIDPWASEPPTG